jgi:hypothetical protein
MAYSEKLVEEESWDAFDSALEEAVENYAESLQEHLTEEYSNYNITLRNKSSDEEFLEVLGLNDYGVELSASDRNFRSYDINLPDIEEHLIIEVERSVAENSIASDEDRETVAYTMDLRSDHESKFRNIRSEFCRLTQPDTVKENNPVFYREGVRNPLRQLDSWDDFDENEIMEKAIDFYEESFTSYPVEADFDVELGFDSGKGWRIYEFDFDDVDEPLHLEITLRDRGFSLNWRPDEYQLRYKNFIREGFAEAIETVND